MTRAYFKSTGPGQVAQPRPKRETSAEHETNGNRTKMPCEDLEIRLHERSNQCFLLSLGHKHSLLRPVAYISSTTRSALISGASAPSGNLSASAGGTAPDSVSQVGLSF